MNRTLRGWFEYFKHSHKTTFPAAGQMDTDAASQHSAQARASARVEVAGRDHQRWPNAFFAEHGLFSLVTAHASDPSILCEVNHQLESRMREIRTSGSEGGGAGTQSVLPTPIKAGAAKIGLDNNVTSY